MENVIEKVEVSELERLNFHLKKYRKYSPKTKIANAVKCSTRWVGMVISGKYGDENIVAVGWEVVKKCKELRKLEIEKAKANLNLTIDPTTTPFKQ